MSRKRGDFTKFFVKIDKKYNRTERLAIASDIIDHVIERTQDGKDKNGNTFRSGYSKSYANSPEGKAAGKRAGSTPDLTLTTEMLSRLRLLEHSTGELVIGYDSKDSRFLGKVEGNIRGTYGNPSPIPGKSRDFLDINQEQLTKLLKRFPVEDDEKRKEEVDKIKDAFKQAGTTLGAFLRGRGSKDGEG